MKFRITDRDVTVPSGEILTEADFERMADEAELSTPDYEAILARAKGGRPSLGDIGVSKVLQVRLDAKTHDRLADVPSTTRRRRRRLCVTPCVPGSTSRSV